MKEMSEDVPVLTRTQRSFMDVLSETDPAKIAVGDTLFAALEAVNGVEGASAEASTYGALKHALEEYLQQWCGWSPEMTTDMIHMWVSPTLFLNVRSGTVCADMTRAKQSLQAMQDKIDAAAVWINSTMADLFDEQAVS